LPFKYATLRRYSVVRTPEAKEKERKRSVKRRMEQTVAQREAERKRSDARRKRMTPDEKAHQSNLRTERRKRAREKQIADAPPGGVLDAVPPALAAPELLALPPVNAEGGGDLGDGGGAGDLGDGGGGGGIGGGDLSGDGGSGVGVGLYRLTSQ
jgi:hypothetical protein